MVKRPYAQKTVITMMSQLFQWEDQSEGKVKIVRNAAQLAYCLQNGIFAIIIHFEGAEAIDKSLDSLQVFYQAGLRSLGLVWSRPTRFGHGVPFSFPAAPDIGKGLTKAGKRLVKACNELGILVDMSHLNEKGFWDVAKISDAPLVCTHSGAYTCCPSPRNLLDKQLDALAETGGVTGINFHKGFLREDGRSNKETSVTEIVRHAAYIADRIGVDHVSLGSDFDGASMPDDLKDAAGLPKLIGAFREHGFNEEEITKIAHGNWLRVLRQTWKG
jgi:membrane dipeptidase